MNFASAAYYPSGFDSLLTTTRASTKYGTWADGHLSSFANNVPAITDLGLLVEESRTNVVLWCRDLTNAAWTKSNVTAALTQTGVDNTANGATLLTATAGNGTVLQAITLGSSARFQSAYVKRITGSGAIQMTMDNGATWTAITVTAAYTQLTIPTQTLANPTVGFRIVTSGDAIAVDFVQNENSGTNASSAILTTSASATRAADVITLAGAAQTAALASASAFFVLGGATYFGNNSPISFQGSPNVPAIFILSSSTSGLRNAAGNFATATFGSGSITGLTKIAAGYDATSLTMMVNGGTKVTSANAMGAFTGPVSLGAFLNGSYSGWYNGYMQRVTFGPAKGQFDGMTSP